EASQHVRRYRDHYGLDTTILRHAFEWLPNPGTVDTDEASRSTVLLKELIAVMLVKIPVLSDDRNDSQALPFEFDRWVMNHTAAFVAQLDSDQEAEELWKPILDLGPSAHYWVEDFLDTWTV